MKTITITFTNIPAEYDESRKRVLESEGLIITDEMKVDFDDLPKKARARTWDAFLTVVSSALVQKKLLDMGIALKRKEAIPNLDDPRWIEITNIIPPELRDQFLKIVARFDEHINTVKEKEEQQTKNSAEN